MAWEISSCTRKMSSSLRSKVADHSSCSLAASTSCALMRTLSPCRRTEPLTRLATPSWAAISRLPSSVSRNRKDELRDVTFRPGTRASTLISSSDRPSEKYSCSGSVLMLTKGSSAIECGSTGRVTAGAASTGACGPAAMPGSGPWPMMNCRSRVRLSAASASTTIIWSMRRAARAPCSGSTGAPPRRQANHSVGSSARSSTHTTHCTPDSGSPKAGNSRLAMANSNHDSASQASTARTTFRRRCPWNELTCLKPPWAGGGEASGGTTSALPRADGQHRRRLRGVQTGRRGRHAPFRQRIAGLARAGVRPVARPGHAFRKHAARAGRAICRAGPPDIERLSCRINNLRAMEAAGTDAAASSRTPLPEPGHDPVDP